MREVISIFLYEYLVSPLGAAAKEGVAYLTAQSRQPHPNHTMTTQHPLLTALASPKSLPLSTRGPGSARQWYPQPQLIP